MKMFSRLSGVILIVCIVSSCSQPNPSKPSANATGTLALDSAKAIAEEAWIYALPLMNNYRSMYLYALDTSYVDYAGGFNKFKNYAKSFTDKDTSVMTPNNDTPYSWAILNLTDEPMVLEVPPVPNRYYSLQFIDLYTYNFN